ncbi:MAG: hypothetical protein CMO81_00500 [Waddliaceae bacterium]|nr:hypothetical protein [Waddliaceae bacterium]
MKIFYLLNRLLTFLDTYSYLFQGFDKFTNKNAKELLRQIFSAIEYLLEQEIFLEDLNIDNILMDQSGAVRIIDFGEYKPFSAVKDRRFYLLGIETVNIITQILANCQDVNISTLKRLTWARKTFTEAYFEENHKKDLQSVREIIFCFFSELSYLC